MKTKLIVWLLVGLARSGIADGSNEVSSITVTSGLKTVQLTRQMQQLNESPFYKSWIVPFENEVLSGLFANEIEGDKTPLVSVGVVRSATPNNTNFTILLSTTAIMADRKLTMLADDTSIALEATSSSTSRSEERDTVVFRCEENLIRKIAEAKSVHTRFVQRTPTGELANIDRQFSRVNISRFKTFVDVIVDGKQLKTGRVAPPTSAPQRGQLREGIPLHVYESILTEAKRIWPSDFEMQEYTVKKQVDAYKKLQNP